MADDHVSMSGGDVELWVEQGASLCIKAVTAYGDPVELTAEEARSLAQELNRLAEEMGG